MIEQTGPNSSVFQRAQRNGGAMMGPNHPQNQAYLDEGDQGNDDDAQAAAAKVPGYRESDDPNQMCKNCQHFEPDENGECELYHFNPKPYKVCDTWMQMGSDEEQGEGHQQAVIRQGPTDGGLF
jgi:hypothetical protein